MSTLHPRTPQAPDDPATEKLRQRASELAMNHGRPPECPSDADWKQAQRELAGMELKHRRSRQHA